MPIDSFTKKEIPKGTGHMYVKKDGTVYWFANTKTEKNFLKLKRKPSETKWTDTFHHEKQIKQNAETAKKTVKKKVTGKKNGKVRKK